MQEGTKRYIEQNIPTPYYSDTKYLFNAAGVGSAMLDFREYGAVLILVSTLSLTVPAGAGIFLITDQFGRVIMQGANQVEASGDYQRDHIIQGGYIQINSSIAAISFTVGFQYVSYADKVPGQ